MLGQNMPIERGGHVLRFRRRRSGATGDPWWWKLPALGRLSKARQRVLDMREEFEDPDAARRMMDAHPQASRRMLRDVFPEAFDKDKDEGRRAS